jgi:hypothetical protein
MTGSLLRVDLVILDGLGVAPLDDTGIQPLSRLAAGAHTNDAHPPPGRTGPLRSMGPIPARTDHRRHYPRPPAAPRHRRHHPRRLLPHERSQTPKRVPQADLGIFARGRYVYPATSEYSTPPLTPNRRSPKSAVNLRRGKKHRGGLRLWMALRNSVFLSRHDQLDIPYRPPMTTPRPPPPDHRRGGPRPEPAPWPQRCPPARTHIGETPLHLAALRDPVRIHPYNPLRGVESNFPGGRTIS